MQGWWRGPRILRIFRFHTFIIFWFSFLIYDSRIFIPHVRTFVAKYEIKFVLSILQHATYHANPVQSISKDSVRKIALFSAECAYGQRIRVLSIPRNPETLSFQVPLPPSPPCVILITSAWYISYITGRELPDATLVLGIHRRVRRTVESLGEVFAVRQRT